MPPEPIIAARQVAAVFESIAPLDSGIPGDELGFLVGDPDTPVRGIACLWNAHSESLQEAVRRGCNLLIVHETPFYERHPSPWYAGPESEARITANQKRRNLIEQHNLVIYRSHSNWDALDVDGVPDQAVRALGLPVRIVARQKFFKVHELDAPISVAELAEHARRGLEMPWTPRIFGPSDKMVQRFAFLIGGFGGNQLQMPQAACELGAQAIIVGEMLEWIAINSLELGMPVVETLHSLSEIPAIRRQSEMLSGMFPTLPVEYVPSGVLTMGA